MRSEPGFDAMWMLRATSSPKGVDIFATDTFSSVISIAICSAGSAFFNVSGGKVNVQLGLVPLPLAAKEDSR